MKRKEIMKPLTWQQMDCQCIYIRKNVLKCCGINGGIILILILILLLKLLLIIILTLILTLILRLRLRLRLRLKHV